VIHSILSGRAILHLREQAKRDVQERTDNTFGMTDLDFAKDGPSNTKKSDPSSDGTGSTAIASKTQ